MFPACVCVVDVCECFPRVRGDVPDELVAAVFFRGFSPRARGCSFTEALGPGMNAVFPACAGMFLIGVVILILPHRFPRVRGDVPRKTRNQSPPVSFSPRARGCSSCHTSFTSHSTVFPACAGMFPGVTKDGRAVASFPRVRGDVPDSNLSSTTNKHVFPACAGMFPSFLAFGNVLVSFPRVRGDVPHFWKCTSHHHQFSPRARGCSG